MRRRSFLGAVGLAGSTALAGCGGLRDTVSGGSKLPAAVGGRADPGPVSGRVAGADGAPVEGATVEAFRRGPTVSASTRTAADGSFELPVGDAPVWLRVSRADSLPWVRAVAPGTAHDVALLPRRGAATPTAGGGTAGGRATGGDGTDSTGGDALSLAFGGDVMFGRRFYVDDTDPLSSSYRLRSSGASHRRLLAGVAPLFRTADVAAVNLETPLTTSRWRHPTKAYTFVSHPTAAEALAWAGVDYAALGNTHAFDALTPGLSETTAALDAAGLSSSGAGESSARAWAPAIVERRGTTLAVVSCTTTAGAGYDLDWAADRDPARTHTVRDGERTLRVPGGAGVAAATPDRLRRAVADAVDRADAVVVQLHAGDEYRREPTPAVERLVDAAVDAGATLVVAHHPHVTGGLDYRGDALVAWSLGNLVFDQTLWETYRSFVLLVDLAPGGGDGDGDGGDGARVVRAAVEPIVLEGYAPRGVTGRLRRQLLWETASLSGERFLPGDGRLTTIADRERSTTTTTATTTASVERTLAAGTYVRHRGWVAGGAPVEGVSFGRDRLFAGGFEDVDVDATRDEGTLWRFGRSRHASGPSLGADDTGGVELTRVRANESRAVLTPRNRIPIAGRPLTLYGRYRSNADDQLALLVSWYDDTRGSSFERRSVRLPPTDGAWDTFARELTPPARATRCNFFFRLSPPEGLAVRRAAFDDVRLVEWSPTPGDGRGVDHLRLERRTRVPFERPAGPTATVDWRRVG